MSPCSKPDFPAPVNLGQPLSAISFAGPLTAVFYSSQSSRYGGCAPGYHLPTYAAYVAQPADEERPLLDYRGQPRLTPAQALPAIETERQQALNPIPAGHSG